MNIALVQMDVAHGQPVENKKYVKEMLERALDDNPDVIVLPEMWNTGYALDELDGLRKISWYRCRDDIPRYDGTFIYAI